MNILNLKSDMEVIEAALLENISGGAFECCATGGGTGGDTGGGTGGGDDTIQSLPKFPSLK
jgi:hypothetical protein